MVKVLGKRVLLKKVEEDEDSKAKIIIPDSAKQNMSNDMFPTAEVVSVGNKCEAVKKGDIAFLDGRSTALIKLEGEEFLITDEDSIIAIK